MALSDGHSYRLDAALFAWQPQGYETAVVRRLLDALRSDSVFWDVGAHVGLMTLMASRKLAGGSGRVYAIEPSPTNAGRLRWHVEANGVADRVTIIEALVGDSGAESVPFVYRPGECTANSLAYQIEGGRSVDVPMVTVDSLVTERGLLVPDVIKIDVEGYEHHVLRGARHVLAQGSPLVICAMHPEPLAQLGGSVDAVLREMHDLGFEAFDLDGRPLRAAGFEEVVFAKSP